MPIPKPRQNEQESDFISRCMGNETMNNEYPDNSVRSGVCYTQWRNRNKAMNERLTVKNLEIKSLNSREFEGYGSVFGNVDFGGDVVLPGAFKKSLTEHKLNDTLPLMFWMHKPDQIPGKWLEMEEDSKGLYVKGVMADTELGRDVHTLLKMKAVKGLSIGYSTYDSDYTNEGIRLLKGLDLHETSIVSLAMNPLADVTHAKSRLTENGEYVPELAEFKRKCEQFFRDQGISRSNSELFVSNMFKTSTAASAGDDRVILDKTKDADKTDNGGVTPDEIELRAGLAGFEEKITIYEMEKIFKNAFG